MPKLSLNVDLGELPGEPEELYAIATMVNVACGGHAGDERTMTRAVSLARAAGAVVAAHPSYPDREGFGRTSMVMAAADLETSIRNQIAFFVEVARRAGARIDAVKPHGALYHDAARSEEIAKAVLGGIVLGFGGAGVAIVGPPAGALRERAEATGLPYWREGFADRTYRADGRLAPRSDADALITDPAAARAQGVRLAAAGTFDTLCVHGDTPGAVAIARAVREGLEEAGLLDGEGAQ